MFRVMLCGASDTDTVSSEFADVVRAAGGDPWHFLDGSILYLNTADASHRRNSAQSIAAVDLAVFVILETYGQISWDTELLQALDDGKPVILMCLDTTYRGYLLRSDVLDPRLAGLLTELEVDRALTLVRFSRETFSIQLRRQLATVIHTALGALQSRNRRSALAALLGNPERLTPHDLALAREVALDEFEDKRLRKQATRALAATGGVDDETLIELVRSEEQGVSRLALALLPGLHGAPVPSLPLIDELVEVCNESDDVGLGRRLATQLFASSPAVAVTALQGLELHEIGLRRRVAAGIIEHIDSLRGSPELVGPTVALLTRSVAGTGASPWLKQARALLAELGVSADEA